MNTTQKKILLAVDGSDQSLDAVRYVSKIMAQKDIKVVLFHVIRTIDEAFWDMGIKPMGRSRMASIKAWETQQMKSAEKFMAKAHDILINTGVPKESAKVNIHKLKVGIARDIAAESRNGYSAVVVGRKGLSKLKDIVLGSVANKLIEKIAHVPLWVVGGRPEPQKILLAFDSSEGSKKAVDYVGTMLGGSNSDVTLLYAIRDINILLKSLSPSEQEEFIREGQVGIKPVFDEAKNSLINAGFDSDRVTTRLVTEVSSRAGAIIEEAKRGGYGTIVVGRWGLSKVEEFFMGRVSNKIVHMAKEMAVWVVS